MSEPSSYGLSQAISVLMQARERLLADEELAGDQDLLADWLASDPQTCAEFDYLPRLARAIIALEGQEKLAKERAAEIKARADRFADRAETLRRTLLDAMTALDMRRLRDAEFTASVGPGRARVVITDATKVPDEYCKFERTPRLSDIGAALDRGVTIDGAVRSNPGMQLTIRKS